MEKLNTKGEVAVLNQGWFSNGDILIRTGWVDFSDKKLQSAKKENKPYAVDKYGKEISTVPDLEKLVEYYIKKYSEVPLDDTFFIHDDKLKCHCFYNTEKEELVYIQEKYKKLFGAKAKFYPTSVSSVVVKVGSGIAGIIMLVRMTTHPYAIQKVN